nr:GNAT family N-acetyltransferase [Parafrankia sp. CH37]
MIMFPRGLGVMPPLAYPVVLASPTAGEPQASALGVPMPHRPDGQPLFCAVALAERIERAEAHLITESSEAARRRRPGATGFATPLAGGVASFADEGSPLNKIAGLGFAGTPEAADLDEVERAFAACGSPVQVELAHLADPAVGELLTGRGYRLVSFENVLGRVLEGCPDQTRPPGVEVRPSGDDEFELWLDVVFDGFAHPDTQGVPSHEDFPREVLADAVRDMAVSGVRRYLALCDGSVAGGASMRTADGVAQLTGAATAPAHRRRGVQSALLAARLADAVTAGCDIAVVTTQPGSTSQQNAQRQGFDLLYTRAVLVKHA